MNRIDRVIKIVFNGIGGLDGKGQSDATVLLDSYIKGDKGDKGDRGPLGFNGSIDNFVVLTEAEYFRLSEIDPNKFYFTYEDDGGGGGGDDPVPTGYELIDPSTHSIYGALIEGHTFTSGGIIVNHTLNI